MYSDEQYRKALEVYEETKSVTKTMVVRGKVSHWRISCSKLKRTWFGIGMSELSCLSAD